VPKLHTVLQAPTVTGFNVAPHLLRVNAVQRASAHCPDRVSERSTRQREPDVQLKSFTKPSRVLGAGAPAADCLGCSPHHPTRRDLHRARPLSEGEKP
jgi:hypothetical protein